MELTLTIDDKLARRLRALAEARGLCVDEVCRQALQAGVEQLVSPLGQLGIVDLGPLHSTPPTVEQIARMRSPIIAQGSIPPLRMTMIDPPPAEQHHDAN